MRTNEELVGRAIRDRRDEVVLATKFGFVSHAGGGPGVLDSSPANIRTAVEGSLERLVEEAQVALDVLAGEARVGFAPVVVGELLGGADLAGEEAVTERRVGDEADAELAQERQQLGLRITGPERVLRLQGGDRVDGMGAADRLGAGLGQADVSDLALGDELRHGADRVLDRCLRVDPVLVVEVEAVGAEVEAVASEAGATPAQVALAWLLAQGDDIGPIPGTKRVSRVEENTAADQLELSAEQIERLNTLTPAAGERHEEAQMAVIDR
jgi:Aldo/keto reductase family